MGWGVRGCRSRLTGSLGVQGSAFGFHRSRLGFPQSDAQSTEYGKRQVMQVLNWAFL